MIIKEYTGFLKPTTKKKNKKLSQKTKKQEEPTKKVESGNGDNKAKD